MSAPSRKATPEPADPRDAVVATLIATLFDPPPSCLPDTPLVRMLLRAALGEAFDAGRRSCS